MCNLSKGVEENALARGMAKGMEKGRAQGVELTRLESIQSLMSTLSLDRRAGDGRLEDPAQGAGAVSLPCWTTALHKKIPDFSNFLLHIMSQCGKLIVVRNIMALRWSTLL